MTHDHASRDDSKPKDSSPSESTGGAKTQAGSPQAPASEQKDIYKAAHASTNPLQQVEHAGDSALGGSKGTTDGQ